MIRTNWMRTLFVLVAVCAASLVASPTAAAQDSLFSGRGFAPEQTEQAAENNSRARWAQLIDSAIPKPPKKRSFNLFGSQLNSPERSAGSSTEPQASGQMFGNLPSLFPKRDPNQPNVFEQMNSKSKDFFERTSDWAHQKNQNLKEKTFETWDSITKDLKPATTTQSPRAMGTPPPLRTAENVNPQSSVRF